ncbi:ankyrin repeat domain-containing protein [bacterium]|nr:ankyrin repeat domain-containing protein [bacterium]
MDPRLKLAIESKNRDDIQNVVDDIINQMPPFTQNNFKKNRYDKTFLVPLYAIHANNMELLKLYIEDFKDDINQMNFFKWTLLCYAVVYGRTEIVNYLLEKGADVNIPDTSGKTPLMFAATSLNKHEILKALLDRGAVIDARDQQGKTALMTAREEGNDGAVKIMEAYAPSEALQLVINPNGHEIFWSFSLLI